jgi:tyrosyl-tRNA synthetase
MEHIVMHGEPLLVDFLAEHGLVKSKSEARRLIQQSGVKLGGQVVSDINTRLGFADESVVQVGKRKFVRVTR